MKKSRLQNTLHFKINTISKSNVKLTPKSKLYVRGLIAYAYLFPLIALIVTIEMKNELNLSIGGGKGGGNPFG